MIRVIKSIYNNLPKHKKAQELFDFICKNVTLPDTDAFQIEQMSGLVDKIIDGINWKQKEGGE